MDACRGGRDIWMLLRSISALSSVTKWTVVTTCNNCFTFFSSLSETGEMFVYKKWRTANEGAVSVRTGPDVVFFLSLKNGVTYLFYHRWEGLFLTQYCKWGSMTKRWLLLMKEGGCSWHRNCYSKGCFRHNRGCSWDTVKAVPSIVEDIPDTVYWVLFLTYKKKFMICWKLFLKQYSRYCHWHLFIT
jgi:hypothetical protein